ncbi:2-oxoacid:acceptor oxidoreductase family protein [Chloroflexota bacterium]
MKEIRLFGRGGQGVALAAEMLVAAFGKEGKHSTAFPMFAFERRGAPVTSFVRVDDIPIREKTQIYNPDCVVITDPSLRSLPRAYAGIKPGGTAILNARDLPRERPVPELDTIGYVDATGIALAELGIPATNTCMLGAFASITGWLSLDSLLYVLEDYFKGNLLANNRTATAKGFKQAKLLEIQSEAAHEA